MRFCILAALLAGPAARGKVLFLPVRSGGVVSVSSRHQDALRAAAEACVDEYRRATDDETRAAVLLAIGRLLALGTPAGAPLGLLVDVAREGPASLSALAERALAGVVRTLVARATAAPTRAGDVVLIGEALETLTAIMHPIRVTALLAIARDARFEAPRRGAARELRALATRASAAANDLFSLEECARNLLE